MSRTVTVSDELFDELQAWPEPRQRVLAGILRGLHRAESVSAAWLDQLPPQAAARLEVEAARRVQRVSEAGGQPPEGVYLSGETARRVVGDFLLMEVGNLLGAEAPALESGDPPTWVVPVALTNPQLGRVGEVGALRVNAQTGELEIDADRLKEIESNADALAGSSAP